MLLSCIKKQILTLYTLCYNIFVKSILLKANLKLTEKNTRSFHLNFNKHIEIILIITAYMLLMFFKMFIIIYKQVEPWSYAKCNKLIYCRYLYRQQLMILITQVTTICMKLKTNQSLAYCTMIRVFSRIIMQPLYSFC